MNMDSLTGMIESVNPAKTSTFKKRKLEKKEQPPAEVIVVTNPAKISRDKYSNILNNKKDDKQYRVVYDKRVILDNLDTFPFGF